jgi:uncharacterized protein YbjT (DUF2867 family)
MRIVVVGGTGRAGSALLGKLAARGHDIVSAAPSTGVNCLSGDGLAAAVRGAQVVVDVSEAPSSSDEAAMDFFTRVTTNLLAAEMRARVSHHVALSVVGTRRLAHLGSSYFRAKLAQQQIIEASDRPYSILYATQFFESLGAIADAATVDGTVHLPPVLARPIAVDEVAAALAKTALGSPLNTGVEVAGPDPFRLDDLVRRCLAVREDGRDVVADPRARFFGAPLTARMLMPRAGATIASIRLADWLEQIPVAA